MNVIRNKSLVVVLVAFTIFCIYFAYNVQLVRVYGNSMEPTIHHGQTFVVLNGFPFHWDGQVINFVEDGDLLTKRILNISEDGTAIYVLGDNHKDSIDSRIFGPINRLQIVGVYLFGLWF